MDFTRKATYSYLLGSDIFVAPVLDETGTVSIDFPEGSWVYAFDESQTYADEISTSFTVSLDEYPVFFRDGSEVGRTIIATLSGD